MGDGVGGLRIKNITFWENSRQHIEIVKRIHGILNICLSGICKISKVHFSRKLLN